MVAYHDLCEHEQVPVEIEKGFHDYRASCENYFCNLIGPDVDQTKCVSCSPQDEEEEDVCSKANEGSSCGCANSGKTCQCTRRDAARNLLFASGPARHVCICAA